MSSVKVATRDFSANGSTRTGFVERTAAGFLARVAFFEGAGFLADAAVVAGAGFLATAGAFRATERAAPDFAAGAFGAAPRFTDAGRAGFLGFFCAIFA
jgi:hypothetical protein